MSACPAFEYQETIIPQNSLSLNGKVSGMKDLSFVLPVLSWWQFGRNPEEYWDNLEVLAGDLDNKNVGQGLAITLDIKSGENFPSAERVLDAFKSSPFVRVSSVLARKGFKSEIWHYLPPKYAFQIDMDKGSREQVDSMIALAQTLGANGYVARQKGDQWSCNITFFQSNYTFKPYAVSIVEEVADLFEKETGAKIDIPGSKNDLIKSPWAVRRLIDLDTYGLHLEGRSFTTRGPMNGLVDTNLWFVVKEGQMVKSKVLESEVEIWNENVGDTWQGLRNRVEAMLEVEEEKGEEKEKESVRNEMDSSSLNSEFDDIQESSNHSSLNSEFDDIQESLAPSVFVPPQKKKKTNLTPFEYFPGYGIHRHDTISVLWKADLKSCWKKHGTLPWEEMVKIYHNWEKVAGEITGKGQYGNKGMSWLKRNWKSLIKKKPSWLVEEKEANFGMLKRVAGKLLRSAKLALELNIEGKMKDLAGSILTKDEYLFDYYLQVILSKKVSNTTEWRYRKMIEDETKWIVMAVDVLGQINMNGLNKGEKLLMNVLQDFLDGLTEEKKGEESVRNEINSSPLNLEFKDIHEEESVRNEMIPDPSSIQTLSEMIKKPKEGQRRSEEMNDEEEDKPNWTKEDENWIHVESFDSFNHLNTDFENRMMGADYIHNTQICDDQKHHFEGLFPLRDDDVRMSHSCVYIGKFPWEDSKSTGIDWEGIHGKVFKAEEEKENKPQKSPVSFADIRDRLRMMG